MIESIAVDGPVNSALAEFTDGDANTASVPHLAGFLLRNAEVDVDGIERLQRHDRIAAGRGTDRG